MDQPVRKRRRPAVSCTLCRRRKIRCNREQPCNNCSKSQNAVCVFDNPPLPPHSKERLLGRSSNPDRPSDSSILSNGSDHQRPLFPAEQEPRHPSGLSTRYVGRDSGRGEAGTSHHSSMNNYGRQADDDSARHDSHDRQPPLQDTDALKDRIRQLENELASRNASVSGSISSPGGGSVLSGSQSDTHPRPARPQRQAQQNLLTEMHSSRISGSVHLHHDTGGRPSPSSTASATGIGTPGANSSSAFVSPSARGNIDSNHAGRGSEIVGDPFTPGLGRGISTTSAVHSISRAATHKGRLFGQSHWINGVAPMLDVVETIEPFIRDQGDEDRRSNADGDEGREGSATGLSVVAGIGHCKALARVVKRRRMPSWPAAIPGTGEGGPFGTIGSRHGAALGDGLLGVESLPSRALADELVEHYLRTIESVYRILHVPSFRREYEAFWQGLSSPGGPDQEAAPADMRNNGKRRGNDQPTIVFLSQLKLVLAVGAVTHAPEFPLRPQALRWILEAQLTLSSPVAFKSKLTMQFFQTRILALLAREMCHVPGGDIWLNIGDVLRLAMFMGLHRDPARLPPRSVFAAEMRRRLWNTIVELCVQGAVSSGGAVLLREGDWDTDPPRNFDDEQLIPGSGGAATDGSGCCDSRDLAGGDEDDRPQPKPENTYTDCSVALALRRTLSSRLAVVHFLNDVGTSGTYDETLRLDAELRASYKIMRLTLRQQLQRNRDTYGNDRNGAKQYSMMAVAAADYMANRYLSALHVPYFGPALRETAYAYSRKVVVETSLKVWCAAWPTSDVLTGGDSSMVNPPMSSSFSHTVSTASTSAAAAAAMATGQLTPSSTHSGQTGGPVSSTASLKAPVIEADEQRQDAELLSRLIIHGSGFFRTATHQAIHVLTIELKTTLQEDDHYSLVGARPPPRRDLVAVVLREAKAFTLRCIEAGETGVKGYLMLCMQAAQVEGLLAGNDPATEIPRMVLQAAEQTPVICAPILEKMAARLQEQQGGEGDLAGGGGGGKGEESAAGTGREAPGPDGNMMMTDGFNEMGGFDPDMMGQSLVGLNMAPNWDFMMTDAIMNVDDADPMTWAFQSDGTPMVW